MGIQRGNGKKLAKIALGKALSSQIYIVTNVDAEIKKVSVISQSFGITYDINNNIVSNNAINLINDLVEQVDILQTAYDEISQSLEQANITITSLTQSLEQANITITSLTQSLEQANITITSLLDSFNNHIHKYTDSNGANESIKFTKKVNE